MVPSAIIGLLGGAAYFGTLDADPLKPIMVYLHFFYLGLRLCLCTRCQGIDPFFFYGICTVGCVGMFLFALSSD